MTATHVPLHTPESGEDHGAQAPSSSPDSAVAAVAGGAVDPVALEDRYAAHTYHPLPVTLTDGLGSWVTDLDGRRYLDMLSAYSALNFGHRHPRLVAAAHEQLDRLTLTSRAFHNDQLGPFCAELTELVGLDAVIPMNTGAEAVESAIKAARRWAYEVKGVADGEATIITMANCFHGRTTTIVGFSTDPEAQRGFGPFTGGFRTVPYGDAAAIEAAIDDTTAAVLLEPVQGEAGVIVPPAGFLREVREICDRHGVLMIADEIQSGLGRTGRTLACDHEQVRPDLVLLGKALGGGIIPISAVVGTREVIGTLDPGSHGSTFGGNPLACAVAREVIAMLRTDEPQASARVLGEHAARRLGALPGPDGPVAAVRTHGLWVGIDLAEGYGTARAAGERLLQRGVLVKDTNVRTLRLAPPLTISHTDLDWAIDELIDSLSSTPRQG